MAFPEFREQTSKGMKENNLAALKKHLHHHAPMFAYVGFPMVTEQTKKLETTCVNAPTANEIADSCREVMQLAEQQCY
jgi:hypothetical protein